MRKISFNEYNKKRKTSKVDLLKVRDGLEKKSNNNSKRRDREKRILLYKLAKKRREKILKKSGEREYKLIY
ncbi:MULTISPECIES: hypothetical protein [unclassified Candidatus Frackibacter]|uniref:hypothetical protein n=1 Tax=unclassified Candidatus Frackibacter TaxID=2648818 RepID=UPI0008834777|nr:MULTISPECIES: hypothetical protein [unclassified Candidatus Frackibacter]SDC27459.1 hypothetical protein SAMN04515661_10572 [Candidatus Frackibacter sp. WG11]SEM54401.1 hypothetical protein SAMN04488698_10673 [Candidatus Frackibacter sp. WG12]SFL53973.1 hypothetical protein SAMN04488699_10521 [Candidatus Frackibacter sp. WG13]